jgi:putative sugar O-methyltransferase
MISRIIEAYHKAKEAQRSVDVVYQPAEMWVDFVELRRPLIDALDSKDESKVEEILSNFFRNESSAFITDSLQYKSFVDGDNKTIADKIEREVKTWRNFTNWAYPISNLYTPQIGNPYGCSVNDIPIIPSAPRYNYYAHKIEAMLEGIEYPVVAEIGGGIGITAYFLTRKSNMTYINFDLPEILVVCQYYLMSAYPEKKFLLYGEREDEYITSDVIEKYDYVLMPNFMLPHLGNNSVDVFINFHSLSEMSKETAQEYGKHIARVSKGYFYHENSFLKIKLFDKYDEISEHDFGIPANMFILFAVNPSLWGENIYREYIYKKRRFEVGHG